MMDDRGVSETLGYVLIFSLVVTTAATGFTLGTAELSNTQQQAKLTNVERAFDVLADNLADVHRHEDPRRATEIRLADGTIGVGDETTVTVGQYEDGAFLDPANDSFDLHPIRYHSDGTEIAYEAGAIVRSSPKGGIMLSEPAFLTSETRTVLPFVITEPDADTTSVGGTDTVLVVGKRGPRVVPREIDTDGSTVAVRIKSSRAAVWEQYFERHDDFTVVNSVDGTDSVTATVDTSSVETVVVARSYVSVEFR
jgi:hypothetical protein